jgi:transposase
MRRYSEAVKADVRRRMSPPHRQSVAQISAELRIHVVTLYNWRKTWQLQGEVVPTSEKDPEGWHANDKFTVMLETAGLNATELSAYCQKRGLYTEQVGRWRQASQDANEKPVLTLRKQKELVSGDIENWTSAKSNGSSRSSGGRRKPWRRRERC